MGVKQLQELLIPSFDLPDNYILDKWNIKEWDYYKNSPKAHQDKWDIRSSVTSGKLDFTLCENPVLREELKYYMYAFIDIKKITLGTFAEKYDLLKQVMKFLNQSNFNTITANGVLDAWYTYFESTGNKLVTDNGSMITKKLEMTKQSKRNRTITFFESCIKLLKDYYEKDIPEEQKDIWHADKLIIVDEIKPHVTINFERIKIPKFKQLTKDYVLLRLNNTCFVTMSRLTRNICNFFVWLYENYPEIKELTSLNRDIIEDYLIWIKTESGYSKHAINEEIRIVKQFLDLGAMYDKKNFPTKNLIIESDFSCVINKAPNPLKSRYNYLLLFALC